MMWISGGKHLLRFYPQSIHNLVVIHARGYLEENTL